MSSGAPPGCPRKREPIQERHGARMPTRRTKPAGAPAPTCRPRPSCSLWPPPQRQPRAAPRPRSRT
eukprot:306051-Pyramimonas_sp.AAC.1